MVNLAKNLQNNFLNPIFFYFLCLSLSPSQLATATGSPPSATSTSTCTTTPATVVIASTARPIATDPTANAARTTSIWSATVTATTATVTRWAHGRCSATGRASASANRESPARSATDATRISTTLATTAAPRAIAIPRALSTILRPVIPTLASAFARTTWRARIAGTANPVTSTWTWTIASDARPASATDTPPSVRVQMRMDPCPFYPASTSTSNGGRRLTRRVRG